MAKRMSKGTKRAKGARRAAVSARRAHEKNALLAAADGTDADLQLDALSDLPSWGDVVAHPVQLEAFDALVAGLEDAADVVLGCVCRLDRGFPAVLTAGGVMRAEHAVDFAKGDGPKPAVGDWVALRADVQHDMGVILQVLPRVSEIARWKGGARGQKQTLAANVDVVLVAQPLGERSLSLNRLARAAVVVRDCGGKVAVVLTKADRVTPDEAAEAVVAVHRLLGEVPLAVVARQDEAGEQAALAEAVQAAGGCFGTGAVAGLVPPQKVGMVFGESGVGKSTLLNALLGHQALETGAVRGRDDAGRHTTVARRMVKISGEGVIIDCPGLRSLPLVGHERGLQLVFPAIAEAAESCYFNDCTHSHEPNCGVQAAFAAGAFSPEALEAYLALAAEMRSSKALLDPDVHL